MEGSNEIVDSKGNSIGENTPVNLRLGFLLTAIGGIIGIVVMFITLRSDVVNMLGKIEVQERLISTQQAQIIDFKIHIQSIDDNLAYLKQVIETDREWHRTH